MVVNYGRIKEAWSHQQCHHNACEGCGYCQFYEDYVCVDNDVSYLLAALLGRPPESHKLLNS